LTFGFSTGTTAASNPTRFCCYYYYYDGISDFTKATVDYDYFTGSITAIT